MQFEYRAKNGQGETATGVIEADSVVVARQLLKQRDLYPLRVSESAGKPVAASAAVGRGRRVSPADLLMVTTQLAIMCQSGIDLAEALKGIAAQSRHARLRPALLSVYQDVSQGTAVSEAMRKHPAVFSETYVASITAGERSGAMVEVLQRLAHLLRSEVRLRGTVWSILAYPVVLSIVASGVIAALVLFVLPQFRKVFEDLGQAPPPLTQMLLDTSQWVRGNFVILAIGLAVSACVLLKMRSSRQVGKVRDALMLNTVILRSAMRPLLAGRTFRWLGTMLQTGIPLLECIQLCRGAIANQCYRDLFARLESEVLRGGSVHAGIADATFLPDGIAQMVATAERSGRLAAVLVTVGEYYEDEGERRLRDIARLLEPAIIVLMGAIVAVVVLSVVLPLLDVSTMTHV
jgi:type II secretory pathway component PulF